MHALAAYCLPAVVFKDPVYAPYLDLLCKFFFLSSAIHQAVFCVLSTLPYAIGQVQVRSWAPLAAACSLLHVGSDGKAARACTWQLISLILMPPSHPTTPNPIQHF